jgi:hypothetical protein
MGKTVEGLAVISFPTAGYAFFAGASAAGMDINGKCVIVRPGSIQSESYSSPNGPDLVVCSGTRFTRCHVCPKASRTRTIMDVTTIARSGTQNAIRRLASITIVAIAAASGMRKIRT